MQVPSPAWAAGKKTGAKPPVKNVVKARAAPKGKKKAVAGKVAAETGVVDILDGGLPGLRGRASFYGQGFHGRKTSTGERFDQREFTGASNHFPLKTRLAVQRLDNGRCAIVKINDRMHARHRHRIIDVSKGVAEYLDMIRIGVVLVRVTPISEDSAQQGQGACVAAFELVDQPADSLGPPSRLPSFGSQ